MNLSAIKTQAEQLSSNSNSTYNQSLNQISEKYGYKSYQALLASIKKEFIQDTDKFLSFFKKNIFDNRKHIVSNFKKINNLYDKYENNLNNGKFDEDEEEEEQYDEMRNNVLKIEAATIKLVVGKEWHRGITSDKEAFTYAVYTTCETVDYVNSIDGSGSDYGIWFNLYNNTISIYSRYRTEEDGFQVWTESNTIDIVIPWAPNNVSQTICLRDIRH